MSKADEPHTTSTSDALEAEFLRLVRELKPTRRKALERLMTSVRSGTPLQEAARQYLGESEGGAA
jgi:hypothetical protein